LKLYNILISSLLACFSVFMSKKEMFLEAGFFLANQSFSKAFEIALIGSKNSALQKAAFCLDM